MWVTTYYSLGRFTNTTHHKNQVKKVANFQLNPQILKFGFDFPGSHFSRDYMSQYLAFNNIFLISYSK